MNGNALPADSAMAGENGARGRRQGGRRPPAVLVAPHSLAVVTNHRHCEWSRSVAVPRLAEHPVVNAAIVAELLEVSEQSARVAISKLANLGVLTEFTPQTVPPTRPGRPRQWWVAIELLVLLGR